MSPAGRHRLTFSFLPLGVLQGWRCISPAKLPGSPGPRGAGRRPSPGEGGRTRAGGRAGGVAHGVGSAAGSALASPPPRFLPAPGRAGRPRGWEAAVLQARSHGEPRPLGGTSFPWARSLPPQPADGRRRCGESRQVVLGGRWPAELPELTASKVEVTTRPPPPWAARGWREPLAVELVLGDYGVHSSGPQAIFLISPVAGNCAL